MSTIGEQLDQFCREIRRRREGAGLTLEQLAERSGLTPNYLGTVENGKRDPSISTVFAIASGLGVKPAEMFGGTFGLSAAAHEAAFLYERAPPDIQGAVQSLLRAFNPPPSRPRARGKAEGRARSRGGSPPAPAKPPQRRTGRPN
jgi:transcriptional regulator with XRE-family HTH domain